MAPSISLDLPADGETTTWGGKARAAWQKLADLALPRDEAIFEKTVLPRGAGIDDAAYWNSLIAAGTQVIRLVEGQVYRFDSYIFTDPLANADRRSLVKIVGNNARVNISAAAGLRASVGPSDPALKYLIFVNTLASALNPSTNIVANTEANTSTGSGTQKVGRGLILEDIDFRGPDGGLNVKVYNSNNASVIASGKTGFISGDGVTFGYSDVSEVSTRADNPYTGGTSSPANFVQWGNGDGIDVHGFSDARGRVADVYNVNSGSFRNIVGGGLRLTDCRACTIMNVHIEGDESLRRDSPIELRGFDGVIRDSEIWAPTTAKTFPAISVDNTDRSADGSSLLIIDNTTVRHVYRSSSVADERSTTDLSIAGLRATDRIQARGFFAAVNVLGSQHTARIAPVIKGDTDDLNNAINSGLSLIATGYWDLVRIGGAWRITAPAPFTDLMVSHTVPQPTGTVSSVSSPKSTITAASYAYVLCLMDEFGNYGPPLYIAATAIAEGQTARIISTFNRSNLRLAIWRRTGASGTYDRYIEIGVMAARVWIYDTGENIMKQAWRKATSTFPQPPAGGTDSSGKRVRFDGASLLGN